MCSQVLGTATRVAQGGVIQVLMENLDGWSVDSTHLHGTNIVSWELVSRVQGNPLIGAYLPLSTLYQLTDPEEELNRFLGRDSIVIGDLNTDIRRLQNPRIQQVADFLASFGLVDLLSHFRQYLRFFRMKMWCQVKQGRLLYLPFNYVLGSELQLFKMV